MDGRVKDENRRKGWKDEGTDPQVNLLKECGIQAPREIICRDSYGDQMHTNPVSHQIRQYSFLNFRTVQRSSGCWPMIAFGTRECCTGGAII